MSTMSTMNDIEADYTGSSQTSPPLYHLHLSTYPSSPGLALWPFFYSPFVLNLTPLPHFFSLLPWHSRSSSVRLLEWMMESCVLPSNCGYHGNLARTAAFACQWGEMKLIKGGIKWMSRTGRVETERMTAIKENNQV